MLNQVQLQTKNKREVDIRQFNLIACQINNLMVNLNQFELYFSDKDVLRNYSLKLAQNLKEINNRINVKSIPTSN